MLKMRSAFFLLCLLAGGSGAISAQTAPQNLTRMPPLRPPTFHVPNARQPVVVESALVDVSVVGKSVSTRYEFVFRNPNSQALEGMLDMPLAPGQRVTGFALDINGHMRDAVAVPKEKGRAVFEAIERRGVDPGLLEQTAGNHYRVRVFPLPANGSRSVAITVDQDAVEAGTRDAISLSLGVDGLPAPLELRVTGAEEVKFSGIPGPAKLKREGNVYTARMDAFELPPGKVPQLSWDAANEPLVWSQRDSHGTHAVATVDLGNVMRTPATFKHLGLLWDASLSGKARDNTLMWAALDRLLKSQGDVVVSLAVIRDTVAAPLRFNIHDGNTQTLRDYLAALDYDGATNLGAIRNIPGVDRYLYVGDGLKTYGSAKPPMLDAPLDALASGQFDGNALRAWTEQNKGQIVAVQSVAGIPDVDILRTQAAFVTQIELTGAKDAAIEHRLIETKNRIRFAARLLDENAYAVVHWADAAGAHETRVQLGGPTAEGSRAGKLWAQWTLQALEGAPRENARKLQSLAGEFGIANAESSLIVLEDVADYVRYEIAPPAELREAYAQLVQTKRARDVSARQRQLDQLAKRYAEREVWWNTVWPKGAPPKVEMKRVRDRNTVQAANVMRPMPAPLPPQMMAMERSAAADASGSLDAITVTGQSAASSTRIALNPWQPDSPSAKRLRAAPADRLYAVYLDERNAMEASPAFYLDAATVMIERGERTLALRVLSNLVEIRLEERHIMRVLAYRLQNLGEYALALPLLERVAVLAPDEPQSARDLALALQKLGQYQAAADRFYDVVSGHWEGRFSDIDLIALVELNAMVAAHPKRIDTTRFDSRLMKNMPVGLRTVLSWDMDDSDMDLWVTDPNGERVFYGHKASYQGGRISQDFTGGYGPEEFVLKNPKPGKYIVEADFYGSRNVAFTGEPTLSLWFSTGFGTPNQQDKRVDLRLKGTRDNYRVGEFIVK